ncbi:MAG: hypothetical protein ACI9XO_004956, partial [Paraglaciecola sp.]|jgi:hypothetical protein
MVSKPIKLTKSDVAILENNLLLFQNKTSEKAVEIARKMSMA